jgi:hypothetical protein
LPLAPAAISNLPLPPGFAQFGQVSETLPFSPPFIYPGQAKSGAGGSRPRRKQRCRQFDTQGFCPRGLTCPYDHSLPEFTQVQPVPMTMEANDGKHPCYDSHGFPSRMVGWRKVFECN